jgi:hypothetical protein
MASLSVAPDLLDTLLGHLGSEPESIAFMRCKEPGDDKVFRIDDLYLVDNTRRTIGLDGHCDLDDSIRSDVIKWASESQDCLVEAHSHGLLFPPTRFSGFDLNQLRDWVPHVRWRLGGRPYAALVTASREVDGIAWCGDDAEAIDEIRIDGQTSIATTSLSFPIWEELIHGNR